jgi:prepilin-type N-terminal cleavage/methylation domain-containing protein
MTSTRTGDRLLSPRNPDNLPRVRKTSRGFTLLEVVTAMTIAAILLATLYSGMFVANRARRSATAAVDPARAASVAAEMMTQDLQGVLPPTGTLRGQFLGQRIGGTSGNADSVEFYCMGQDPVDPGGEAPLSEGVRKVVLILRTDVTPPMLVRQVTRNLLAPTAPQPEEEVICRNVRSFTVQYFDGFSWLSDWDSTMTDNVLPAAVAIRLEMENPSALSADAPPLVISRVIPLACARPLTEPVTPGGAG